MLTLALDLALALLALPILVGAGYLLVLAIAARQSAPPRAIDGAAPPRLRFAIVVPAHDEEAGIGATIASLLALDYPRDLFRILVVADNCADATATRAEAAGATVLVRVDPARRGKGHALAHAFAHVAAEARADAVVVVDADTEVSPNLLRAFSRRFEGGAQALQASYGVRNPGSSWRTRLMVLSFALFHLTRSLGRERLGLSSGLRGNGMGMTRALLARVPYAAFSIVEDVEYGLLLGEAGCRVHHVPEAEVRGDMVAGERGSRSQRRRWEQGRRALAASRGPALLSAAIRRRDPVLLDLALDLLVPPLATLSLITLAGALAALVRVALGGPWWPAAPWLGAAACLVVYVLRGWRLSGTGARGLVDLLVFAPVYVLWKIALSIRSVGHRSDGWVRTGREGPHALRPLP
jgi:cellulose synthase/poly-beta-1,6-N-acetylglucosamine synthase-like glycosyltransferase